jgi:hypothetical protein
VNGTEIQEIEHLPAGFTGIQYAAHSSMGHTEINSLGAPFVLTYQQLLTYITSGIGV